jgi:hypothetical protein
MKTWVIEPLIIVAAATIVGALFIAPWWFSGLVPDCLFAGRSGACVAGTVSWMPFVLAPVIGAWYAWGTAWDQRQKRIREQRASPSA